MNTQNMTTKTKNILTAVAAGLALCLGLGTVAAASGSASVVDTGFCVSSSGFDGEFKGERSYNCGGEAVKMVAPKAAAAPSCVLTTGLLGADPRVSLRWTVPDEMKGYTVAESQVGMLKDGAFEPIKADAVRYAATTGKPDRYETIYQAKPLSTALLGNSWTFGVRFVDAKTGMASQWLTATATMGNAGTNPQCYVATR